MNYTDKKKILELIREIGAENNLIRVDGTDLLKMFGDGAPVRAYASTIRIQDAEKLVEKTLKFFQAETKHPPKSIYIKITTFDDLKMAVLESIQSIGQTAGENVKCVFAYNRKPDISQGQCCLEMLVA